MKLKQIFESLGSDFESMMDKPTNTREEDLEVLRQKYGKEPVDKLVLVRIARSWFTLPYFEKSIKAYGFTFEQLNKSTFFKKAVADYVDERVKNSKDAGDDHYLIELFNDIDGLVEQWEEKNVSLPEARKKVNDFLIAKMKEGKIVKSLLLRLKHGDQDDAGEDGMWTVNTALKRIEMLGVKSKEIDLIKSSLEKDQRS